jgi:CheY-like chemotaxis protein
MSDAKPRTRSTSARIGSTFRPRGSMGERRLSALTVIRIDWALPNQDAPDWKGQPMVSRFRSSMTSWSFTFTLASIRKMHGFHTHFFINPPEALEVARPEAPDLLILDVMMREMTGIEIATKLKEFCSDCKVLLFSGQAHTADLLKRHATKGMTSTYLPSPFTRKTSSRISTPSRVDPDMAIQRKAILTAKATLRFIQVAPATHGTFAGVRLIDFQICPVVGSNLGNGC